MTEPGDKPGTENSPAWRRLWQNTDLQTKLGVGTGLLLLLMILIAALSLHGIRLSEYRIQHVRGRHVPTLMKLKQMRQCFSRMMVEERNYLLAGHLKNRQAYHEKYQGLSDTLDSIEPNLSAAARSKLPALRTRLKEWRNTTEKLFRMRDDPYRDNPAKQYCASHAKPIFVRQKQRTNRLLERLADSGDKHSRDPATNALLKRAAIQLYRESLETIIDRLEHYAANSSPSPKYALQSDLEQHDRYWDTLTRVFPAETNSVQKLADSRSEFLKAVQETVKVVEKKGTSRSMKQHKEKAVPQARQIRKQLAAIISIQEKATTQLLADAAGRLSFLQQVVFAAICSGLALSVLLAFIYRKSILKPVQRLTDTAETIAGGDLKRRADLTGDDEIGRMGTAFNTMATELQDMIHRLKTQKNNLEDMVAQRTRQLTRTTEQLKEDVRKRARVQAELRESERHLRTTLKSIADAVIATDASGDIEWMNPAAEKLTGWSEDEARERSISEVLHTRNTESDDNMSHPINEVLEDDKTIQLGSPTILVSQDGSTHYINDSAAPIHDDSGRQTGAVVVFRDVTEKRQKERELRKMQKLESLGTLAGGIAHDFNNMLQGIFGHMELAQNMLPENSKPYHYLESASEALETATKLTSQLLTFAKGGEPVVETVDLKQQVRDNVEFHLRGSNIQPEFDLPDDLWAVAGDSDQISQVISNLTINAKEASPTGGQLYVTARNVTDPETKAPAELSGRYVKLQIRDEGTGIPKDILDQIFDPYFTSKQDGSGLGLSIVYSIIENHDGHIEVESTSESGTTFSVYIPAEERGSTTGPENSDEKGSAGTEGAAHVLLMDDDETVRELARKMLQQCGHSVETVEDGEEAIQQYARAEEKHYPFDLVIMDLTVPGGMGGKEAVEKLLEIDPDARVIVSSGYSSDPVLANYEDYGFIGRLKKPFNIEQLQQEIGRAGSHASD